MTDGEKENLKEKIKTLMLDHLKTSVNYPDCSADQILGELKSMWVKLEEASLIVNGMNFKDFVAHSQQAAMMSQVRNIFNF